MHGDHIVGEFPVEAGQTLTFTLQYGVAHKPEPPRAVRPGAAIAATESYWRDWINQFRAPTEWSEPVRRSLITLQALTELKTGGIIAAPTTSLPEVPGGASTGIIATPGCADSTFALTAFLNAGYREEAGCWRDWLLRAAAGAPERLRTMYRSDGGRNIVRA